MTRTADEASGPEELTGGARERLLEAAVRVAVERGLDGITWDAVAREAGVSRTLIGFYFGTTDELVDRALERVARQEAAIVVPGDAGFDQLATRVLELMAASDGRALLQYDHVLRAARGDISKERIAAVYRLYFAQAGEALEAEGIDDPDGALAELVCAILDGLVLQHAVYGASYGADRVLTRMRQLIGAVAADG
ncbi:TetR/AcrR family transcriptional regulator [Microbacterium gorillae]|uniref:TetR/AcrR family transcriptional regulator n=1 Tax=Microbacterium gorillae TaxID=1231063 RepID=UPI0006948257|nr:TetR/AcrR family transcriptional regulator [Microbacterium gorillae]